MTGDGSRIFPLSAIVGQESLKLALLLSAVDPGVGGVLVRGERGTAKSTAVRALSAVMPAVSVVEGCRFSCDPDDRPSWCDECRTRGADGPLPRRERKAWLVELPVSATEDRLVGTLDFEHALKHGERRFEPGLLARANRSILYVDEVNLLDDHLVDTLLDAAAMGVNTVEREGVSFRHPSRFVLVGTMNPEEGDLRPQLLDRFGLCVDVTGEMEPDSRVEIVRRRRDFDTDPEAFGTAWAEAESEVRARIRTGRSLLGQVGVPDELLYAIANLALTVGVEGHRADQAMARGAAAHAALEGRTFATSLDVGLVAPLVLAHRTRRTLFDEPRLDAAALGALIATALSLPDADGPDARGREAVAGDGQATIWDASTDSDSRSGVTDHPDVVDMTGKLDSARRAVAGTTQRSVSADRHGRYSRTKPAGEDVSAADVAFDATLRSAAASQRGRADANRSLAVAIDRSEVQEKVRSRKVGAMIVFCVDASGSMGAAERVSAARDAVLGLLEDAYQRRDRVALVSFRGDSASLILAPTASVQLARTRLRDLPTGGATPLAAGILAALDVLAQERLRDRETVPWIVLLSDGRANVGVEGGLGSTDALSAARLIAQRGVNAIVVDAAKSGARGSRGRELATAAGAHYVQLGDDGHSLLTSVLASVAQT